MSLDFLVWLLVFFIQLGLLGITMYIVSSSFIQILHSAHPCLPTSSWALVLLINSNIALVLQLITLSDLEADYLNPHDSSVIVNYWLVRACLAPLGLSHVLYNPRNKNCQLPYAGSVQAVFSSVCSS